MAVTYLHVATLEEQPLGLNDISESVSAARLATLPDVFFQNASK
jgi:hypothetical protein